MSLLVTSRFARDLVRLLAGWVACIVFVQATAAAVGGVQGPRHVHVRQDTAAALFVHAADRAHAQDHDDHGRWARHVHLTPTADATLYDDAQDLGAAASLMLSAMVALAPLHGAFHAADGGHVMCASATWSCITHAAPFPERPPRA